VWPKASHLDGQVEGLQRPGKTGMEPHQFLW
jgi:hypothetical protein